MDVDQAAALARALGVSERTGRLLVGRGVVDADAGARFLNPRLEDLPDPALLKDVDVAAARLSDAIQRGETVALYGDYDVDGVTSTALLASFLSDHGLTARTYIPRRLTEGYGLNPGAVDQLAAEGTQLLVTLDCGITAADEIDRANAAGMDCVVVDHHRCPPKLPRALATLNHQQADCRYPEKTLAAVGVCFQLVIQTRRVLRERGFYSGRPEPVLRRLLDLVALGTICDMVPLVGANRVLAHFGMRELQHAARPGVRALMDVSRVRPGTLTGSDVGFRLGPRINAAGRLDDASVGVRLLLAERMNDARRYADTLDVANGQRKDIEARVFQQAVRLVDAMPSLPPVLVLADEQWHPGVVGICASKLVERYERPTILVGEGGRGSGRTAQGVHLYNAMRDASSHLTKFGGHQAAAGLRIPWSEIDAFRRSMEEAVLRLRPEDRVEPVLNYDDELSTADIDEALFAELDRLAPFGNGNPEPLFRAQGVAVKRARVVGKSHLKFRVPKGSADSLDAIAFKRAELLSEVEQVEGWDMAFHVDMNEFGGVRNLQLRVRDLRRDT